MKTVRCINIRPYMPNQVEVGKTYYMDETTIWCDTDGDEYAAIYKDELKHNKIGNLLLSHFCIEDKDESIVYDSDKEIDR